MQWQGQTMFALSNEQTLHNMSTFQVKRTPEKQSSIAEKLCK